MKTVYVIFFKYPKLLVHIEKFLGKEFSILLRYGLDLPRVSAGHCYRRRNMADHDSYFFFCEQSTNENDGLLHVVWMKTQICILNR